MDKTTMTFKNLGELEDMCEKGATAAWAGVYTFKGSFAISDTGTTYFPNGVADAAHPHLTLALGMATGARAAELVRAFNMFPTSFINYMKKARKGIVQGVGHYPEYNPNNDGWVMGETYTTIVFDHDAKTVTIK